MRNMAFVMLCLVLGGCARDPYVTSDGETLNGNWYIAHQVDRVTGTELPSSVVFALASNTNVAYPRASQLQLTCLDGKPLVRLAFDFKIGNDRDSVLGYRFDDGLGHDNVESRVLRDRQIILIEDPGALSQFVGELPGARKLYVRIRSMNAGRTAVEYDLEGSAAAIQAAFAKCPMASAAKRISSIQLGAWDAIQKS